jgi:protoheme IX farnesyltransferase
VTVHYEPDPATIAAFDAAPPSSSSRSEVISRPQPSLAADLVTLTKPRITLMVAVTMLAGIWLASYHAAQYAGAGRVATSAAQLAAAVVGTVLVVGSANALNMYIERFTDRLMVRTQNRPLPTGRLSADLALWFGLALGAVAVPVLTFTVNAITGLLAAVALVSYVVVYTPLKRKTTLSLLVGAVPGAIPPLLGWTAVTGRIQWPGVLLFGIMFIWQVPHFLAIATFRRDDYARAGLKVLPVERGDRVTRIHIVAYLIALLAVSFALVGTGVGGRLYLGSAVALGAVFLGFGVWGLRPSAGVRWARGLFAVSILYLVLLFAALMVSP